MITGNTIERVADQGISTRFRNAQIRDNVIRNGRNTNNAGIAYFPDDPTAGSTLICGNTISAVRYAVLIGDTGRVDQYGERFDVRGNSLSSTAGSPVYVPSGRPFSITQSGNVTSTSGAALPPAAPCGSRNPGFAGRRQRPEPHGGRSTLGARMGLSRRARLQVIGAAAPLLDRRRGHQGTSFAGIRGGLEVASLRSGVAAAAIAAVLPGARRGWTRRTWLVGTAYAVTVILFVLANKQTTAANAIFLQSTAPLYVLLAGLLLLHERVRGADVVVMLVIVSGARAVRVRPAGRGGHGPAPGARRRAGAGVGRELGGDAARAALDRPRGGRGRGRRGGHRGGQPDRLRGLPALGPADRPATARTGP